MESAFRKVNLQQVPQDFICPISQIIMKDPVFNREGISFERKFLEDWIKKKGNDPFTRQPLQLSQIKPNLALRNTIQIFVRQLPQKQRQRMQLMEKKNLQQAIKILGLQMQKAQTPMPDKSTISTVHAKIQMLQTQLFLAKEAKQFGQEKIRQQSNQINLLRKQIKQLRAIQIKSSQLITQLMRSLSNCQCQGRIINKHKQKEIVSPLKNIKQNEKDYFSITPDINSYAWKHKGYQLDKKNAKICISNGINSDYLCSVEDLPMQGSFKFGFNVINIQKQQWNDKTSHLLRFGVMQSDMKSKQWRQNWGHVMYLYIGGQYISKPHQNQRENVNTQVHVSECLLHSVPSLIYVRVNRLYNNISWEYNQLTQATLSMPQKFRKKRLCAVVMIQQKGNIIQFM